MNDMTPISRRPGSMPLDPAAGARRQRKAIVKSIHIKDEVFRSIDEAFKILVKRCEDDVERFSLVVPGPTGAGKSHVLDHISSFALLAPSRDEYGEIKPLVRVSAPSPCTLKSLGHEVHRVVTGFELSPRMTVQEIWSRVRAALYNFGVWILMIDEFHHVFETVDNATARQMVISTLKSLLIGAPLDVFEPDGIMTHAVGADPYPLGLVLSGMPYLERIISIDPQLRRRSKFFPIEPMRLTDKSETTRFEGFVQRVAAGLGFSPAPDLASADMVLRLHKASNGYRGRAAAIIKEAAFLAIDLGDTVLDRKKHLARVFDETYRTGDLKNPFLVADPATVSPPPEAAFEEKTRLRGRKKPKQDD